MKGVKGVKGVSRHRPARTAAPCLRLAVFVNSLPALDARGGLMDGVRYGGVQKAAYLLTRALAARGHDVWVFGSAPRRLSIDGGEGRWHVRASPASLRVGQADVALGLFRDPGRHLAGADVVLAYMGDQPAPTAALRWARRWRAPLVVSYHGDPVHGFGSPARRLAVAAHERWLGPRVLHHAAAIIALTAAAASSSRLVARRAAKVRVIPNGVERLAKPLPARSDARRAHGLPRDAPVVLFVGSLTPIKGVDVLLDAFARLPPAPVLVVVGEGPARAALADQAARLGVADRVHFLGFVTDDAKRGLMAAADVLAMPSRSEAFPLTLLEAGQAGLPTVASRIPVLEALVDDGSTGLLVPGEDPASLAAALGRLLGDAALRGRLGAGAQAWAAGFTWEAVAVQTEEVLRSVIPGR
ncbi:MAG: glycosyltransferase family 4 protein [Thermoplasmatota archaeon]